MPAGPAAGQRRIFRQRRSGTGEQQIRAIPKRWWKPGEAKENGSGVEPDCGTAAGWHEKVSDPGNAEAMLNPGFFEGNRFGAVHDCGAAGIRLDKAAQRGNAEAMKKPVFLYADGPGGSEDPARPAEWYRYAAGKGSLKPLSSWRPVGTGW